ncbi:Cytochrome c oxidase subunit VIIa [Nesidiocoris tenuis]|nr:Cytochrome c oxidase subunit VIIa [Nesidiocoris tenuis]
MIGLARSAVTNVARRGIATSRALCKQEGSGANKVIKAKQEKFGAEDGTPIFLKGGAVDRILYGTTMSLCVFALGYGGVTFYEMAQR